MRTFHLTLLLVGLFLCSGCTAIKSRLSQNSPLPSAAKESRSQSESQQSATQTSLPDYETPEKMLALWKDSVRTENGSAMRGFGGRLYLYNANGDAIRAEGDLIIYGFDDSVTNRQGSKADRKIVISNHQLQKQYSKTALGPSYSIWITWDPVGSIDKNVTLVPFFRSSEGKIVQAGQAINALHTRGKKTNTLYKERISAFKQVPDAEDQVSQVSYLESNSGNQVQLASHAATVAAADPQAKKLSRSNVRTTTIALPRGTRQRLRSSDFGTSNRSLVETTISLPTVDVGELREGKPLRIDEARKQRKQQLKEGNVFGMPGQL